MRLGILESKIQNGRSRATERLTPSDMLRSRITALNGRAAARGPSPPRAAPVATTYTPKLRQLGESDLVVPEVCLGTMTWGQQNTEAEAHEQLSYALDRGVNFMDAAEMYPVPGKEETQGLTERYIGSWLKNQRREDLIIASKVAGKSERMTYLRDNGVVRVTKADIKEGVDKILTRLGTDYIDLLQIHWPDRYVSLFGAKQYDEEEEWDAIPFEEQLEGMKDVIDAGKVRHIGVSNETSYGVMEFIRLSEQLDLPRMISIQNSYSLITRGPFETNLSEVSPIHRAVTSSLPATRPRSHAQLCISLPSFPVPPSAGLRQEELQRGPAGVLSPGGRVPQRQVQRGGRRGRQALPLPRVHVPVQDLSCSHCHQGVHQACTGQWHDAHSAGFGLVQEQVVCDQHHHRGHDQGAAQGEHRCICGGLERGSHRGDPSAKQKVQGSLHLLELQ